MARRRTYVQSLCCVDCRVDTVKIREEYMVKDDVWAASGMAVHGGRLCIGCLENRLGRRLERDDFIRCPLNDGEVHSLLLDDRLGVFG